MRRPLFFVGAKEIWASFAHKSQPYSYMYIFFSLFAAGTSDVITGDVGVAVRPSHGRRGKGPATRMFSRWLIVPARVASPEQGVAGHLGTAAPCSAGWVAGGRHAPRSFCVLRRPSCEETKHTHKPRARADPAAATATAAREGRREMRSRAVTSRGWMGSPRPRHRITRTPSRRTTGYYGPARRRTQPGDARDRRLLRRARSVHTRAPVARRAPLCVRGDPARTAAALPYDYAGSGAGTATHRR
jgi:hypothetical protein